MRSFQEIIRAISVRWIIRKTLCAVIYCVNPFRIFKWFLYIVLGSIALGMLTLAVGNYARAAEWTAAYKPTSYGQCVDKMSVQVGSKVTVSACADILKAKWGQPSYVCIPSNLNPPPSNQQDIMCKPVSGALVYVGQFRNINMSEAPYSCPPPGKPDFTMGPIVNSNGTVCEKKPIQCLIGSIKETNTITGKEFCRPICKGISGNSLENVSYFQSMFGSVQIQCYGQCSVQPSGVSISSGQTPNIFQGDIKFTGENCPVQTNGETDTVDQSGDVQPPTSSDATNGAQNELQNAASGAISNTVSGSTGTADLNSVVDKIAQASNAEIKASSEQNAALGKVIQNTGKDIQSSIKEAQLSASQGNAGASMGQIQTANAIKDGNAQLGAKLDGIKDAIEAGNEDGEEEGPSLPPGDTDIKVDPSDVNPHPNDWGTRNYNTVMQHHVAEMNALPLFAGISGFFEVDMGPGTCPSFSLEMPDLGGTGGTLTFDMFCNTDFQRLFEIIALCVKLLGLYAAFRIAILD
ncbi:hypothetical protein [Aeromonas tecta]|uniref:hypothetical protein n=1 Tax=Aeromonas tecta TaxID=324617 RepID=UPI000682FE24|nr:hypothetical protein [Aeromonas tecta]